MTRREAQLLAPWCHDFKTALLEYQQFMSIDYQREKLALGMKEAVDFDGELGPVSKRLLTLPGDSEYDSSMTSRCRFPDKLPRDHGQAASLPATVCEAVLKAYSPSMADQATSGSGSWPAGCKPEIERQLGLSRRHIVTIYYDRSRAPSRWRDNEAAILKAVYENYMSIGVLHVEVTTAAEADIRVQWRNGAGWIGLAEFNSRSCSDSVFQYMDPGYTPSNIGYLMQLHAHELGHNHNLQHQRQTSGNVMSPSITLPSSGFRGFVPGDASHSILVRHYGGDPIVLGPDEPSPEGEDFTGVYTSARGVRYFIVHDDRSFPNRVGTLVNAAGDKFLIGRAS
jgi:hypothetical protein